MRDDPAQGRDLGVAHVLRVVAKGSIDGSDVAK